MIPFHHPRMSLKSHKMHGFLQRNWADLVRFWTWYFLFNHVNVVTVMMKCSEKSATPTDSTTTMY